MAWSCETLIISALMLLGVLTLDTAYLELTAWLVLMATAWLWWVFFFQMHYLIIKIVPCDSVSVSLWLMFLLFLFISSKSLGKSEPWDLTAVCILISAGPYGLKPCFFLWMANWPFPCTTLSMLSTVEQRKFPFHIVKVLGMPTTVAIDLCPFRLFEGPN